MDFCEFIMMLIKNLKNYESKNITKLLYLFEMFKLWNVLRTCLEVVKLKGFHVFVYVVGAEQCCIVLWKFSRMSVKRILAKQILPSISRVSIIKELSPLIYANVFSFIGWKNWFHGNGKGILKPLLSQRQLTKLVGENWR